MRLIVLFIFISHLTFAQQEIIKVSSIDHGNALLWKISGNGLKKRFLFIWHNAPYRKREFSIPKEIRKKDQAVSIIDDGIGRYSRS